MQRGAQLLCALACVAAFEGATRALGVLDPTERPDPYLGFPGTSSLYRIETDPRGLEVYRCSPNKRAQYRDERFLKSKPKSGIRIFCLGGSSVRSDGLPPGSTFPGLLRLGIQACARDATVEVINAGGGGTGSHQILEVAREALRHEPDLLVVYPEPGERKYVPPFPEGKLAARDAASPALVAVRRVLASSRLYGAIRDVLSALRRPTPAAVSPFMVAAHFAASGEFSKETFTRVLELKHDRIPPVFHASTPPERIERVLDGFESNMAAIARIAAEAHVPVLFVAPVRNLKADFYLRFHVDPDEIAPGDEAAWREHYENGLAAKRSGDLERAVLELRAVREHLAVDRDQALAFYIAQCLDDLGRFADARVEYERFLLVQPLRVHLRAVAEKTNTAFIDPYPALSAAAPHGIPDSSMFLDANHPNFATNAVIARQILKAIVSRRLVPRVENCELERARQAMTSNPAAGLSKARGVQQAVYRRDYRAAVELARRSPPTNYIERMYLGLAQTHLGDFEGAHATWEALRKELVTSGSRNSPAPRIETDADIVKIAFEEDLLSEF